MSKLLVAALLVAVVCAQFSVPLHQRKASHRRSTHFYDRIACVARCDTLAQQGTRARSVLTSVAAQPEVRRARTLPRPDLRLP
jgi:hypothetical protein